VPSVCLYSNMLLKHVLYL